MAGHMIAYRLISSGFLVFTAARHLLPEPLAERYLAFDAEKEEDLPWLLATTKPDIVVNCIGVLVNQSAAYPIRAIRMNALLPRRIASICSEYGSKAIHISTDCVFSGKRGDYSENDFRDGDDIYARSKALGELDDNRNLTIRTSIIGPELKTDGVGLFNWFMRQQAYIKGYTNHFWAGVTTLELAKCIEYLIYSPTVGLVNLTNNYKISKYELLCKIGSIWDRENISIEPFSTTQRVDKSIVSTRSDFNYHVPSYDKMLLDLRDFMLYSPFNYKY